ncbi:MAG: ATP-binding cassette domain-containing protein [Bacteroidetes bacterium]|nr:ATP-binding cassette domain-containing protein [Bacteroidota bacterium]
MSEPILMALVQLFAIIAASVKRNVSENSRKILESYLRQHLNASELDEYLKLFDELVYFHQPEEESMTLVDVNEQIACICIKVNKGLHQRDKILVFVKFVEFLDEGFKAQLADHPEVEQLSDNYIRTIGNSFNLSEAEFAETLKFVTGTADPGARNENLLVIAPEDQNPGPAQKFLARERLNGRIVILHVPSINTFLCRYLGTDELFLNGHAVFPYRSFLFDKGYILKSQKINPVYYSDMISQFLFTREKVRIVYSAREIEYHFRNSTNGIQPFSFQAVSGELIGVMGGSGVGKSTLLNVLNGNIGLEKGEILINGLDIRKEAEKLRGSIGFVPQDDLLIEELTVFQNLYYNARLCFNGFNDEQLVKAVSKTLADIDLQASKDLKVGDPLNKFISGGQRKRLNIALELIREPSILFADEPTSGLSSMDSEMVMLLLKEQTLKGKLVIVNIHQPSSDIFKLFDKLLIMDKGGYPIFYGNPIDALTYFKTISNFVNPEQSECLSCGFVNPEQILQITEAKTVDEYGKMTAQRKISPKEWYAHFRKNIQPGLKTVVEKLELPCCFFEIPGRVKQFRIFSIRNLLCKITNRQYMMINLLEAPFLAFLLAYLTRYKFGEPYVFGDNRNLVPYLFMSVVVSLFLGMMVSAEEIIKDRRILKREAFLHLSRFSYLNSKIVLLFSLSAIQSLLYVVAGNLILGIHGMTLTYWLILFATSCFANIVGLNISAGLNSVVAIYILIPFILVPQLLLSGTIVPFDYLNPAIASREHVPLVGNMMTSRWTFEALAVEQFSNNEYEKVFYPYDKEISHYAYITAFVIPTLKSELDACNRNLTRHTDRDKTANYLAILKNEIPGLQTGAGFASFPYMSGLTEKTLDDSVVQHTKAYLDSLSRAYSSRMNAVTSRRDAAWEKLSTRLGSDGVYQFKQAFYNENLADLVLNKGAENKIIEGQGRLIRKKDPIFMDPTSHDGNAHFYAPVKIVGQWKIDTFWFNFIVIWLMSFVLYLTLLHDTLRKTIEFFERVKFRKAG